MSGAQKKLPFFFGSGRHFLEADWLAQQGTRGALKAVCVGPPNTCKGICLIPASEYRE